MKLSLVAARFAALAGAFNVNRYVGRENEAGEHNSLDNSACPTELTPHYVVGVWQGSISHTVPPDNHLQHSRITFHSDRTLTEQHEYYRRTPSVLITIAQGYWRIDDRNQLETDVYVDSEFGPEAGLVAGMFSNMVHLKWNGTYSRHTCEVSGKWTGKLYKRYDGRVPLFYGTGEIIYKTIQPAW